MKAWMAQNKRTLAVILVIGCIALLAGGLVLTIKLYSDSKAEVQALQAQVNGAPQGNEAKVLVGKVGRHIVLPVEEPRIITVASADQLKQSQPFFSQASDGDKLLVYSSKVILYNPIMDKIIEVAQIKNQPPTVPGTATPTPTQPPADSTEPR